MLLAARLVSGVAWGSLFQDMNFGGLPRDHHGIHATFSRFLDPVCDSAAAAWLPSSCGRLRSPLLKRFPQRSASATPLSSFRCAWPSSGRCLLYGRPTRVSSPRSARLLVASARC